MYVGCGSSNGCEQGGGGRERGGCALESAGATAAGPWFIMRREGRGVGVGGNESRWHRSRSWCFFAPPTWGFQRPGALVVHHEAGLHTTYM